MGKQWKECQTLFGGLCKSVHSMSSLRANNESKRVHESSEWKPRSFEPIPEMVRYHILPYAITYRAVFLLMLQQAATSFVALNSTDLLSYHSPNQKSEMGLTWLLFKMCQEGRVPFRDFRGESICLPFSVSRDTCIPWLLLPSIFKSSNAWLKPFL